MLMSHKVSTLLTAGKIRLVVIDSVAGLFRGAEDAVKSSADYFVRRSKKLSGLGSLLHRLSARHAAVVIVVNQVCHLLTDWTNLSGQCRHIVRLCNEVEMLDYSSYCSVGLPKDWLIIIRNKELFGDALVHACLLSIDRNIATN